MSFKSCLAPLVGLLLSLAAVPSVLADAPGGVDPTFAVGQQLGGQVLQVAQQPDKNVVVLYVPGASTANPNPTNSIRQLDASGTLVQTFGSGGFAAPLTGVPTAMVVQPADGKVVYVGRRPGTGLVVPVDRLNADGTRDTTFQRGAFMSDSGGGNLAAVALQPDGKILVGGNFREYNGLVAPGLVRLNATGTLDTTFSAASSFAIDGSVLAVAVQPADGKIVVAGNFRVGGNTQGGVVRLNADGSLDDSFLFVKFDNNSALPLNVKTSLAIQPTDGSILVTGFFHSTSGTTRSYASRLSAANGVLDTGFAPVFDAAPLSLAVQADGRIVVGGGFVGVAADDYNHSVGVARLNADGTKDTGFDVGTGPYTGSPTPTVNSVALQDDGKVLVGGAFASFNGVGVQNVVRLFGSATATPPPTDNGLLVPGTANPYLAGLPDGTTASGGGDSAPAQSPVLVPGLTLDPNVPLNFAATGSVSNDPNAPATSGPDGGPYHGATFYTHAPENSFPGLVAPINSLVGVFLGDDAPDPSQANTRVRDFSDAASTNGGVNFTGYQPDLGTVFFIGDGKNANGTAQNVYPPTGATRLFLGVLDGNDYFNNLGQFRVLVTPSTTFSADNLRLTEAVSSPTDSTGQTALIGDPVTYTIRVENRGQVPLTGVVVRDNTPGQYRVSTISDGGTLTGNTVTWNVGTLAPGTVRLLTLVGRTLTPNDPGNTGGSRINDVLRSQPFATGDGLPQTILAPGILSTTLQAAVRVGFTSNGATVTPGGTLSYTVELVNTTSAKLKGVKFTAPAPALLTNPQVYFVDADGARLTGLDASATLVNGQLSFNVGGLKPGEHVYLVVTGSVPYDASPMGDFALQGGQLALKNSDGSGQTLYGVLAPAVTLGGAAVAPPSLTLAKAIPDGPALVGFLHANPKVVKGILKTAPDLPIFKTDGSGKKVLDDAATLLYGDSLNPSIGVQNDEDGFFVTVALPKANAPAPTVTVALFYSNTGGADAQNLTIREPIPEGFSYVDGSLLLNGKFGKTVPASVQNNGRLLVINPSGKLKSGDLGLLLYSLQLNDSHPAAGTVLPTRGTQLTSSGLSHGVNAAPDGPNLLLVGNFFVETETTVPDGANVPVNNVATYDLLLTNTGGKKAKDLQVSCTVPAGLRYLRGVTLRPDKTEAYPAGQPDPAVVVQPAAGATGGQVLFKLGKLGLNKQTRVRVQYTVTNAQIARGVASLPNPFVISEGTAPATALAEQGRIARGEEISRRTLRGHARAASDGGDYVLTTPVVRTADPSVPRIFVVQTTPLAVDPSKSFDYLITVGNLSDNDLGNSVQLGVQVTVTLPDEVDSYQVYGSLDTPSLATVGGLRRLTYSAASVPAHSARTVRVTLRLKAGTSSTTLRTPGASFAPFYNFPGLAAGPVVLRVVPPDQLKVQAADITSAAVARFGAVAANVPNVARNLTFNSTATSVVGADYVAFTNGALLVPLGNGSAFLSGKGSAVASSDPVFVPVTSSTGMLATANAAGKLTVRNLGGVAPGGARSVVLDAAGRSVQTILRQIVASDPNNVVARYGANLQSAGALNLLGAKGDTFVSNEPAPPAPVALQPSLLPPGGLAVATGRDNTARLVAAGALPLDASTVATIQGNLVTSVGGSLVASGGGNVVSNDGGSLVASGGGNASSLATSSLIGQDGGGLIGQDGGGLIGQDGGGLISQDGGGLIGQDGGG